MPHIRPYDITPHDRIWFCELESTDRFDDFGKEQWFIDHVIKAPNNCKFVRKNLQFYTAPASAGENKYQYIGVCGTNLVIQAPYLGTEFMSIINWTLKRSPHEPITKDVWKAFKEGHAAKRIEEFFCYHQQSSKQNISAQTQVEPLRRTSIDWGQFEDDLSGLTSSAIDTVFLKEEGNFAIHFDLGEDRDFVNVYKECIEADYPGFLNWLSQGDTIQRNVKRWDAVTKTFVDAGVSADKVTLQPIARQSSPGMGDFDLSCPPGCVVKKSCSILVGNITSFDPGDTTATIEMGAVTLKPYCVDQFDNPCP